MTITGMSTLSPGMARNRIPIGTSTLPSDTAIRTTPIYTIDIDIDRGTRQLTARALPPISANDFCGIAPRCVTRKRGPPQGPARDVAERRYCPLREPSPMLPVTSSMLPMLPSGFVSRGNTPGR